MSNLPTSLSPPVQHPYTYTDWPEGCTSAPHGPTDQH